MHLWYDVYVHALPSADAAHAVRALDIVAENHVLAEGHDCHGVDNVLDVHARGVDLVVEGEASVQRNATLVGRNSPARGADEHLLLVVVVEEDHPVTPAAGDMRGQFETRPQCKQKHFSAAGSRTTRVRWPAGTRQPPGWRSP